MSDQPLVFRSKVDLWLLIVLLAAPAACFAIGAQYWDAVSGAYWWAGLLLAAGIAFPLWLLFSLRYFLSDAELAVRCGPFTWTVAIAEIRKIAKTSTPLSAPALSLDRLRIDYGDGQSVVISPEPRHEFVRQLEFRVEQLKK